MKPYFRKAGNPASHTHVLPALRRAAFPVVLLAATALAGSSTTVTGAGGSTVCTAGAF